MKILIDNGHGSDTPGKRSPDGLFREYHYNRIIASRLKDKLASSGYDAQLIVPEETDVPLKERCARINSICRKFGKDNCLLVSIHVNAYGNGSEWTTPRGWSVWTTRGETKADKLAECLANAASRILSDQKLRTDRSDGDLDFESDFYILKHTLCPAVITENLFMTNKEDVEFLESEEGKERIVELHVEGVISFLQ